MAGPSSSLLAATPDALYLPSGPHMFLCWGPFSGVKIRPALHVHPQAPATPLGLTEHIRISHVPHPSCHYLSRLHQRQAVWRTPFHQTHSKNQQEKSFRIKLAKEVSCKKASTKPMCKWRIITEGLSVGQSVGLPNAVLGSQGSLGTWLCLLR